MKATLLGVALGVVLLALSRALQDPEGPSDRGHS